MKFPFAALSCLWIAASACGGSGEPKGNPEGTPPRRAVVNPDDPDACSECHAQIVGEWKESMHARAHHDSDPIFAAVRQLASKSLGPEVQADCANCHTPRDPANPDSPAGKLGVSCASCHMLDAVHPGKSGAQALGFADVVRMRAGHDMAPGSSPAHQTGAAPEFIKDRKTVCLACHAVAENPSGVNTCATGAEFEARKGEEKGCMDCHMPRIPGPGGIVGSRSEHARHVFLGPHRAWYHDDGEFLSSAVSLEGTFGETGLKVTLNNETGHGFPTGFPGRVAMLSAVGRDGAGAEVWRNEDSPESVFNKVYVDEAGKPTLPVLSKSMSRDNRLKPSESRTLEFEVPQEVTTVELKLELRLVPTAAAAKLGLAEAVETQPRTVASETITR
ncbi:MAG: multiheme c-type cytochrome [Nannocystales bacterium]